MQTAFTEDDLALLHALQISPRASWADLSRVLGGNPATLATRWQRLSEAGLAWLTVYPTLPNTDIVTALIEVELDPAGRTAAIEALCRDPRAGSIEETVAGRDLIITAFVVGHEALATLVLDDLPRVPGVQRARTHLVTDVHAEGGDWRLDALDRAQRARLGSLTRGTERAPSRLPERYLPIMEALALDGRAAAADVARTTGRNPATVRRQLTRLLASGALSFRCEIAQLRTRWPVVCTWFAQVSAGELERTVRSLRTIPELRLCLSTSGRSNLVFTVWARSANDLNRLERRMSEKLPWLTLVESTLTMRMPKRMGWLLDESGRNTGTLVEPEVFGKHHAD